LRKKNLSKIIGDCFSGVPALKKNFASLPSKNFFPDRPQRRGWS